MIVVDEICVAIECLVGAAAVYLRVVTCGVNLGNRRLHRQGVDSAWQWGVVAAR